MLKFFLCLHGMGLPYPNINAHALNHSHFPNSGNKQPFYIRDISFLCEYNNISFCLLLPNHKYWSIFHKNKSKNSYPPGSADEESIQLICPIVSEDNEQKHLRVKVSPQNQRKRNSLWGLQSNLLSLSRSYPWMDSSVKSKLRQNNSFMHWVAVPCCFTRSLPVFLQQQHLCCHLSAWDTCWWG